MPEVASEVEKALREKFGDNIVEYRAVLPQRIFVKVRREVVRQVAEEVKRLGFDMPVSAGATDYPDRKVFEAFWIVWSSRFNVVLVLKTDVDREKPEVDSLVGVWKGAQKFERETWELMGIDFKGHPKLRRLLLPEDWDYEKEGYPLRKDFSLKPYER